MSLAERLITPTEVFVIMSFAEKGHLKDAYNTFKYSSRIAQDEFGTRSGGVDNAVLEASIAMRRS